MYLLCAVKSHPPASSIITAFIACLFMNDLFDGMYLQVSFHSDKNVRKYVVIEKDKETLRRLVKSKEERCVAAHCSREVGQ